MRADTMSETRLHVRLDGYEGPLDLLLDLARAQKLDLSRISILSLVDQYLAVIEQARGLRLELQADWLVMAAWLAWLKSRLLLPPDAVAEDDPETLAARLADRLVELDRMRAGAAWLAARPQLGRDWFARGAPEDLTITDRSALRADLAGLALAYAAARRRGAASAAYRPKPRRLWSVAEALTRLEAILGAMPSWGELRQFLPEHLPEDPVEARAALASTLIAGLELARGGGIDLRQDQPFGPILLRRAEEGPDVRIA